MSDRDWQEEQRRVFSRLFDSVFERRETSEEKLGEDAYWRAAGKKRLADEE